MIEEEKNVLSLDDLFGQAKPVRVEWKGKMYNLKKVDGFGPRELHRWDRLDKRARDLRAIEDDLTEGQLDALKDATYESVRLLNENLAEKTSFFHQVAILGFYAERVREETGSLEKKRDKKLGLTGETSLEA